MRIDNHVANELVLAARRGERIPEFMDAVAGVPHYRLDNLSRQGQVRSMFAKELIAEQFLLEFEEMISVFWTGVFEHLDKAKQWGETVEIRAAGKEREYRPTQNNPIHFLRYHGYMAVRNHITSLYRKNLEQGCSKCGHRMPIRSSRTCPKCGEEGMFTTYRFTDEVDDQLAHSATQEFEIRQLDHALGELLNEFAEDVLGEGTRAYQVLKILVEPEASRPMCAACGLCGSSTFDIDQCTNYNANIGRWLGVNKTMIANKVRSIRKRLPEWLRAKDSAEAEHLLALITRRFKQMA